MWVFYLAIGRIDFLHLSPFESSLPHFLFFIFGDLSKEQVHRLFLKYIHVDQTVLETLITSYKSSVRMAGILATA